MRVNSAKELALYMQDKRLKDNVIKLRKTVILSQWLEKYHEFVHRNRKEPFVAHYLNCLVDSFTVR